jgi:phosphohistidine phosphatase
VLKKQVFFVRHAKSAWDNPSLSDWDRQLNERGHFAAPRMAMFIQNTIDLKNIALISSPAKRAITTARYFAEILGIPKEDIRQDENLYHGSEIDYLNCLAILDEKTDVAFVFGHNPTIESLLSKLGNPYKGEVPTCAVFHSRINKDGWRNLNFKDLDIINHYFPKIVIKE